MSDHPFAEAVLLAWLQSRLSDEEHLELHKAFSEYMVLVVDSSSDDGTIIVRGAGASLAAAIADLKRADDEQRAQR